MATSSSKTDGTVFTGVEWSSSPVTFHENKGRNVRLTEGNKVADGYGDAIVFTGEPLSVGELLKVTMTRKVGGLRTGVLVSAYVVQQQCIRSTTYTRSPYHITFRILASLERILFTQHSQNVVR